MIRRINFFSGPGGGKSTLAARLFADMKADGLPAEFVTEVVKQWAYLGHKPEGFDQYFITVSQLRSEDIVLRSIPEAIVVTECPILLGACYAMRYEVPAWRLIAETAMAFEAAYPSLNILISRADLPYKNEGRFQTGGEAFLMDGIVKAMLEQYKVEFREFRYDDYEGIEALAYGEIFNRKPLH